MKKLFSAAFIILIAKAVLAQGFDTTTYRHLLTSDRDEFVSYAKSQGLSVSHDSTADAQFASTKGCIYGKPTNTNNNNEYYDLVLLVLTQNQDDDKLILQNAKAVPDQKDTWMDSVYLYKLWKSVNPLSKETWYRFFIYKKKK